MADIIFTDTLKCTATHGRLAMAEQIFDKAYGSDGATQATINAVVASLALGGGGGLSYTETKEITYAEFLDLDSVSKGDVYVIKDSFIWDETSVPYPPYTGVVVMQSATSVKGMPKTIQPLGSSRVPVSSISPATTSDFLQEVSGTNVDTLFVLTSDSLEYKSGDFGGAFDGTYLKGSVFYVLCPTSGRDTSSTIIPLSPTKEKLMLGATTDTSTLESRVAALEEKLKLA